MKTLKEKLEDIIQLSGEPTEYMKEMLHHLVQKYPQNSNVSVFINEIEGTVEYAYNWQEASYSLKYCIGELVLNKGKAILQQIDWLD